MAQNDFGIIDPSSTSGEGLADLLNLFRDGLHTLNSGAARPAYAKAGMLWVKSVSGTRIELTLFDGAVDHLILAIDPAGGTVLDVNAFFQDAANLDAGIVPHGRLPKASQAQAEAGTDAATVMTPLGVSQAIATLNLTSPDISLLYLYLAEQAGDRLNMVGGIVDPLDDSDDISVLSHGVLVDGKIELNTHPTLPPPMASVTVPSPFVVSAQYISEAEVIKAFDGDTFFSAQYAATVCWWKLDCGAPTAITDYQIAAAVNGTTYAPKSWTFQGSNDDASWVVLDTQANIGGWAVNALRDFTLSSTQTYRYYRWNFTANNGAPTTGMIVGELAVVPVTGLNSYPVTVISDAFVAQAVPSICRLGVQAQGVIAINSNLIGYVSRDDGVTWATANLVLVETLSDGTKYFEDPDISLAGQPSGTAMKYKIVTSDAAWTSTDGVLLQWS